MTVATWLENSLFSNFFPSRSCWSFNGLGPGSLESMIRKWKKERGYYSLGYMAGFCAPGNQPEIERERKTQGPKLWWNKDALLHFVKVYIPVASLDKDQETRLYKFTKEARSNRGHKAKRWCISKESHKQSLSPNENANEENPMQASHLFDLLPGRGLPAPLRLYGLIRNKGFKRDRKQHTGSLLWNASWHECLCVLMFSGFFPLASG